MLRLPIVDDSRVEHSMPSMYHVIINGNDHGCCISGYATDYTRVHGPKCGWPRRCQALHTLCHLVEVEGNRVFVRDSSGPLNRGPNLDSN